jgi:heme A synthase
VKLGLPLGVAVAHNAVAALLLVSMVTMNHLLWRAR